MTKMENQINRHHLCAKSRNGSNHGTNILRLQRKTHRALHELFGTKLPHQQIEQILSMSAGVLRDEFRYKILEVMVQEEIYIDKAFKRGKKK